MTWSPSSSSRGRAPAAALLAALVAACAHAPAPAPEVARARVALFPPENLSGGPVPLREVSAAVEAAVARAGVEVVTGDLVQRFLKQHRIRFTGGVGAETAAAARDELGVDALLLTWVEQWAEGGVPRLALTMRLVSAGDAPVVEWIDARGAAGDDHPGWFGLGVVNEAPVLLRRTLDGMARSLAAFLDGKAPRAERCRRARDLSWEHRAPDLQLRGPLTVLVLPFVNRTDRRGAGEVVALELGRQLLAVPGVRLLEPGLVREELLRYRLIMEEGPSLDDVLALGASLQPDRVIAGQVLEYDERGVPRLGFSAVALEGSKRRLVWRSSSFGEGDDGVWWFDAGRVSTPLGLACEMGRGVVEGLLAGFSGTAGAAGRPDR